MTYGELLQKLKPLGLEQVAGMTRDGVTTVYIGNPNTAVVPYPTILYPIELDNGTETEIDEEMYDAIVRRLKTAPAPSQKLTIM
jgi:hypothetical protein